MKLDSDELLGIFTTPEAPNIILQPIVKYKAVNNFTLCENYEDRGVLLMDANWIIKHGYSAYTNAIFELTNNEDKWKLFVDLCGREKLIDHWKSMVENNNGRENQMVLTIISNLEKV